MVVTASAHHRLRDRAKDPGLVAGTQIRSCPGVGR
jgi:hypothetical protein